MNFIKKLFTRARDTKPVAPTPIEDCPDCDVAESNWNREAKYYKLRTGRDLTPADNSFNCRECGGPNNPLTGSK